MKVDTRQGQLYARGEQVTPGDVHTANRYIPERMVFTRAQRAYMWDADGKRYIDYHAAFGPFVLGHAHPEVNRRVIDTIQQTDLFGVGTTDLEVELGAKIRQHVPAAEMVLFCNAGSSQGESTAPDAPTETPPPASGRVLQQQWARLIKQVSEANPLLCPQCGGAMRIIAFIDQPAVIENFTLTMNNEQRDAGEGPQFASWREPLPIVNCPLSVVSFSLRWGRP